MLKRPILIGAALAVLSCSSASAEASLDPLQPCYVSAKNQSELVTVNAHGFTPTAKLDVLVDEIQVDTATVGYDSNASGMVSAPFISAGERLFTVRVVEDSNHDITATATARVTAFSVLQSPRKTQTDKRVHFTGRGFMESRYVYAHYLYAGKDRKTIQISYPEQPCGTFRVYRKQFPIKKPAVGPWTIQFDQEPMYSPTTATKVTMSVNVKRAPKRSRAR